MIRYLSCFGLLLAVCVTSIEAKLAPVALETMVRESTLIARARVVEARAGEDGAGSARLVLDSVYKGSVAERELTLRWTGESHDRPLGELNSQWVLFVKLDAAGQYEATAYGRGALQVIPTESGWAVPYLWPADHVVPPSTSIITRTSVRNTWYPYEARLARIPVILLPDLVAAIESLMGVGSQ